MGAYMLQKRVVRLTILALLVASGIAAAVFAWDSQRRIDSLESERLAIETTTDRLLQAVASISAVQQAYIDYGQRDETSFARVAALLRQVATDAGAVQRSARDGVSVAALEQFSAALGAAAGAEMEARNSLVAGDSFAAADTLFDAARAPVRTMESTLRVVRDAEAVRFSNARTATARSTWMGIGAIALLWVAGLIVLTTVPGTRVQPVDVAPAPVAAPVTPDVAIGPQHASALELSAAAAVCAEIARLTDPAALPDLLRRAATILGARGIVIWMGAGDELFAAMAYGYESTVMSRLRPIRRSADNATAAAWRAGELRTVAAAGTGFGAIIAPIAGPAGPFGVIAAEVRDGREHDVATRAVTAIIASQLAGVLSAWPAASTSEAAAGGPGLNAESDRKAAAS
jgi:hypothetical protein